MKGMIKHYYGKLKIQVIFFYELIPTGFLASSLSTFNFSTFYTTVPHYLIREERTELIEHTFNRDCSLYLACNENNAFLLPNNLNDISCCYVGKCVMLSVIFWTIFL